MFLEGDPAHAVVVVQQGDVKITTASQSGREVVLDVLGPGDIIGELSALDGGRRSAAVVALSDLEVLAIPSTVFREISQVHVDLLSELLHEVIGRLRAADRRQIEFSGDAIARVCTRLVEISERQGSNDLTLPVNQSELAAWTGLSREAVVKALAALRRLGWISTDGRHVRLVEPSSLRARAAL